MNDDNKIGDVVVSAQHCLYQEQKFIRSDSDPEDSGFFDFGIDFPDNYFRVQGNTVLSFMRPSCMECTPDAPGSNVVPSSPPLQTSGVAIPMLTEVLREGDDYLKSPVPQQFLFPVDTSLFAAVQALIAGNIEIPNIICDDSPDCNDQRRPILKTGDVGVTGPTFLDNKEIRSDVVTQFAAGGFTVEYVDMETAAVAHVAATNGKGYLAIRSMSDLAGGEASFDQISQFLGVAAENSVFVLISLLQQITATPCSGTLVTGTQRPSSC